MKPMANDLGMCGIEQMFYAGTVKYNDDGISTGVELFKAPNKLMITRGVAVVNTAFNAATKNVLTIGANDDVDDIMGSADVTEGTKGAYSKLAFVEVAKGGKVKAKFTQTGTAATAGEADIYLFAVGIPE